MGNALNGSDRNSASSALAVPAIRDGRWHSVLIEDTELGGVRMWAVSSPRGRRWFPCEQAAIACAATLAAALHLPWITLNRGGNSDR